MTVRTFDFIIIGGGIVGLGIARSLIRRGFENIAILEKEAQLGVHTSGRNSGVLHAGIYYASDSLRAMFCKEGSRELQDYAREHKISCLKTGKVIVAANAEEHAALLKLHDRAKQNGARVELIDSSQLRELEPEAVTYQQALNSPDTAVIDSVGVLKQLSKDLIGQGLQIIQPAEVVTIDDKGKSLKLRSNEILHYGYLINAAGLQADRLAKQMGAGVNYMILPFKGLYRELKSPAADKIRGSIYPVPDARFPFLGVHVTRTASGKVLLGPTAMPGFGRENYGILSGLDWMDTPGIFSGLSKMILRNTDGIRSLVKDEMTKYSTRGFLKAVRKLAPNVKFKDISGFVKVGLRAQLVRISDGRLEMDFIVEHSANGIHILNAISPGFTCSLPFGEHVAEQIVSKAWPSRAVSDSLRL